MNLSARIRDYIRSAGRPVSRSEVCSALGAVGFVANDNIRQRVGQLALHKKGIVRVGYDRYAALPEKGVAKLP